MEKREVAAAQGDAAADRHGDGDERPDRRLEAAGDALEHVVAGPVRVARAMSLHRLVLGGGVVLGDLGRPRSPAPRPRAPRRTSGRRAGRVATRRGCRRRRTQGSGADDREELGDDDAAVDHLERVAVSFGPAFTAKMPMIDETTPIAIMAIGKTRPRAAMSGPRRRPPGPKALTPRMIEATSVTLVGLEQVGGHAGAVADVVADVVGDGGRVAGVVLGDARLDLADQVGADVGGLGEDAAADAQEQREQRATEAEADEHRGGGVLEDQDDDGRPESGRGRPWRVRRRRRCGRRP